MNIPKPWRTISKSKTFHRGEGFERLMDFVCENIETHEEQPEGTERADPTCELEYKYIVTITKVPNP